MEEAQVTELPRGGTSILPESRVVAFDGAPQAPQLGALGIGTPSQAAFKLKRLARRFERPGRPVQPVFELIATIALAGSGEDGLYRSRQTGATIRRYLEVARRNDFLLVLDLQPGRSTFVDEVKALRGYLRYPDVGIGLDPEWNVGRRGTPGQVIGSVDASQINSVQAYMSDFTERYNLPEKLLIVHQFTREMIRRRARLKPYPGVDMVLNTDGFGSAAAKRSVFSDLAPRRGAFFRGFKVFYVEDERLMQPRQILRQKPNPVDVVIYE